MAGESWLEGFDLFRGLKRGGKLRNNVLVATSDSLNPPLANWTSQSWEKELETCKVNFFYIIIKLNAKEQLYF